MSATGIEIAKPFIKATQDVMSTMAGMHPVVGKPIIKSDDGAMGDVSAFIYISGDKSGKIYLKFSKQCAVTMVKNMLGDDVEDILQDVQDAVGEITNMISGQARAGLSQMGMRFEGSTPTVIMGQKSSEDALSSAPVVSIPFSTESGGFSVEFFFEETVS
jgi:chemotaxis protein CheX